MDEIAYWNKKKKEVVDWKKEGKEFYIVQTRNPKRKKNMKRDRNTKGLLEKM